MIGKLRRIVSRPARAETWDVNQVLELEEEPAPANETTQGKPATTATKTRSEAESEHYTDLVRESIASGGKLGTHKISTSWLRMTLAGLEGRRVSVETMWKERALEESDDPEPTARGVHSYEELFVPAGNPRSTELSSS